MQLDTQNSQTAILTEYLIGEKIDYDDYLTMMEYIELVGYSNNIEFKNDLDMFVSKYKRMKHNLP